MKKIFLAAIMAILLSGCYCYHAHGSEKGSLKVLASTFPVYLFTLNICANVPETSVELLVPAQAGCPHDFSPRPADILKLSNASVLVINGHDLEEFLEKPLQMEGRRLKIINAGENVPTLESAASNHSHALVNPHIFAAPENAAKMTANIASTLAEIDPQNADAYRRNAAIYAESLASLAMKLQSVGAMSINKKIIITHDALAYLVASAGLEIAEILESNDSLARLAMIKRELEKNRPVLLAGDVQYSDRILITLSTDTGIPYALFDVCASGPDNPPLDYYQQKMKANLDILEKYFE